MRVGIVYSEGQAADGGSWTLQKTVADALLTIEARHSFVLADRRRLGKKPASQRLEMFRNRARHFLRGRAGQKPAQLSLLERFLRSQEVDLAWLFGPGGVTFGLPYVITVWDLAHRVIPIFPEVRSVGWDWESREKNYRSFLPKATRVITGTEAGKKEVIHYYGLNPGNVCVIPFPAPPLAPAEPGKSGEIARKYNIGKPFIFYPAQFWPHKNHVNLLLALKELHGERECGPELVLTGSDKGNGAYVRQVAADLDLQNHVHFLGFIRREDLAALYAEALALVFPTHLGPDNLPPLEAFAAGCPVAASAVSGAAEQLQDGALLFNPSDPGNIAAAIKSLRDNEALRARLIRRGREIAALRTPEAYAVRMNEILDEIEPLRRCWGKTYSSI